MNTQVAVSALLVFTSTNTEGYAVTRLWETGLGTVTTLVLAPFLFPANPLIVARAELARVAAGLADALRASTALVGRDEDEDDRRAVLRRVAADIARLSADCSAWVRSSHLRARRRGGPSCGARRCAQPPSLSQPACLPSGWPSTWRFSPPRC